MSLTSGTSLGPYQILAPIGAGGMGEVYRARDTKLKREVALKVLPDVFARDSGRMIRFQREAEVLASLNHPNIAAIYGVEERALVMELVEGETLPNQVPIDTALRYAKQIAEALEYAHDRGVVHRDLKPANVKVTPEGAVKLLDFGLAKAANTWRNPHRRDPGHGSIHVAGASERQAGRSSFGHLVVRRSAFRDVDRQAGFSRRVRVGHARECFETRSRLERAAGFYTGVDSKAGSKVSDQGPEATVASHR
jgi:serine/threonine-protein kinase